MSHDLYASWATAELSRIFRDNPVQCFSFKVDPVTLSIHANRESGKSWPIADGRISAEYNTFKYEIAVELKRKNEGLHGVLTAIGQSHAYLHKGYSASIIIIPRSYDSHGDPGEYVKDVLNTRLAHSPIGVFSYSEPDTTHVSPFHGKLFCHKPVGLGVANALDQQNYLVKHKSDTQWAHLREGSSEPHAFFKYLQLAKRLKLDDEEPVMNLPQPLINAVERIQSKNSPQKYLSSTVGDSFHDKVWRNFWYKNILTYEVGKIWFRSNPYHVNTADTQLYQADGKSKKQFFYGRSDSIKNKLVRQLNDNLLTENEAWEAFAININKRAHSYREDIDSSLYHLGLIESDGKPSNLGYNYVDACEREGSTVVGKPRLIFGSAILKNGGLGAFLHYCYKLSEETFKKNPLKFSYLKQDKYRFDLNSYNFWLKDELTNNLQVMQTSSLRGGKDRKPFQAEYAVLRNLKLIEGFRIGVGLEINWPLVQEYLEYPL